jgi:hypothetical protein
VNVDNGKVYSGEEMNKLYGKLEQWPANFIPLPKMPNAECKTCGGKGSIRGVGTVTKYIKCPQCYSDENS